MHVGVCGEKNEEHEEEENEGGNTLNKEPGGQRKAGGVGEPGQEAAGGDHQGDQDLERN